MTETETRPHRSVSQINQYNRCPYSYYLARIEKVWQRPAAWLAQGSAVHEVGEAWEKSERTMTLAEAQDVFRESYARHIDTACETTPNLEYWFASGPYRGEVDIERRYHIGLEQVEKLIDWHLAHADQVIWIAPAITDPRCSLVDQSESLIVDGVEMPVHAQNCDCRPETPGIELPFDFDLDGVLIRGYIDAVRQIGDEVRVVDYKTGNQPGDDFQLGVYAVALAEQYGVDPQPRYGEYWMGKSGKPTYPYDLSEWTREKVSEKFQELERDIQAGDFDPKPEPSKCRFCDVATSCKYSSA